MSSNPLIGVIVGASRQGRLSEVPAHWIYRLAEQRRDLRFELIDLGQHPLPFFEASASTRADAAPRGALAQHWAAALDRLDGFIVVVPEDDAGGATGAQCEAGVPAGAFLRKPVSFVGYGRHAGTPKVDTLRSLASELQMAPMGHEVHLTMREVLSIWQMGKGFEDYPHLGRAAADMLDELSWWAHALKAARDGAGGTVQAAARPVFALHAALERAKGLVRRVCDRVGDASVRIGASSAGRVHSWPR